MKHGIRRIFALTLALLLALAVSSEQSMAEGYTSRHAGNEVSGAAAALAADGSVPQVLDIATGEMTALTVDKDEVMPWDEFFHRYWREILETPDFYDEAELDELFSEMFIVRLRLEDAGGNVMEEINMFEPTGYGDPILSYGWDERYRNVAVKNYTSTYVDEYYVSYNGVVAVGPARINSDIYVCDGPINAESGAGSGSDTDGGSGSDSVADGGAGAAVGEPLELSDEERYQLNKFLSDFAVAKFCISWEWDEESSQEVRKLSSFSSDNYDAGTLADFGWRIARINQPRDFVTEQIDGNYYDGYSLEFINGILDLYLGITVAADEIPSGEYNGFGYDRIVRDGIVYTPSGDGASWWDLAIERDVSLLGDDALRVDFDVYEVYDLDIAPVGDTIHDDSVYYSTAEEAQNRDTFVWKYSGSAVIGFDGALSNRDSFTMREYTLDGTSDTDGSDAAPAVPDDGIAAPSTSSGGATADNLFSQIPSKYTMSSIGGWQTEITLESNGSFSGIYSSTDPGDSGPGYDITKYYSEFSGKFVNPRQIDDYTWSFELGELTYATPVGETQTGPDSEFAGYNSKLIYVDAYGIEGGKTFYLYMPGAPTADLPGGFIDWAYSIADGAELSGYGIYNADGQYGFVGRDDDWN